MVVFQGFFLQVRSNFDKIITSDALDNKGSNLSLFRCSMKIHQNEKKLILWLIFKDFLFMPS